MAIKQVQGRDVRVGDKINDTLVVKSAETGMAVKHLYFVDGGVMTIPLGRWVLVDRDETFDINFTKEELTFISAMMSATIPPNGSGIVSSIINKVRKDTGVTYESGQKEFFVRGPISVLKNG